MGDVLCSGVRQTDVWWLPRHTGRQTNCLFVCLLPAFFVPSGSPSYTHRPRVSSTQAQFVVKCLTLPSTAMCHQPEPARPSDSTQCCNYGVLNHQNDISTRLICKKPSRPARFALTLVRMAWEIEFFFFFFFHCCVIIMIGIYESHQTFSQEEAAFEGDSGMHLVRQRTQWNKPFRQPASSHQAF